MNPFEFPTDIADSEVYGRAVAALREGGVLLPSFAQLADPATIPEEVTARLGLRDVRVVAPEPLSATQLDPLGILWRDGPDHCCHLRKVLPLRRALAGFDAWITGLKRYQGDARTHLEPIEAADGLGEASELLAGIAQLVLDRSS